MKAAPPRLTDSGADESCLHHDAGVMRPKRRGLFDM